MRAIPTLEAELVGAVSGSRLMEHVRQIVPWPRHAGTAEEREAFGYLQQTLDGYGWSGTGSSRSIETPEPPGRRSGRGPPAARGALPVRDAHR